MHSPAGGFLRPKMAEMIEGAAREGFQNAGRLWGMSLREAELELTAFAARRRAGGERDERLAWMAGYCAAIAVHAPRRYPRRSGTVFHARVAPESMTEAQMKRVLQALAAENARDGRSENHDT